MAAKYAVISLAASGELVPLVDVFSRIRVLAYLIVAVGAVNVTWVHTTAAPVALSGVMTLATGVPNVGAFSTYGLFQTPVNVNLGLVLSGAVQVSGWLVFQETPG